MSQDWERELGELEEVGSGKTLRDLLPLWLTQLVDAIPKSMMDLGQEELKENAKFSDYEEMLRISFWEEYRRAVRMGTKMTLANIYGGICTKNRFEICCKNSFKLAFLIQPPKEVQVALEHLLDIGLDEMKSILRATIYDKKGNIEPRMAHVKLKVLEMVMARRRGVLTTRSEVVSKNLNVNIDKTPNNKTLTLDEINAKIKELESGGQKAIEARDVSSVDESFSQTRKLEVVSEEEEF